MGIVGSHDKKKERKSEEILPGRTRWEKPKQNQLDGGVLINDCRSNTAGTTPGNHQKGKLGINKEVPDRSWIRL